MGSVSNLTTAAVSASSAFSKYNALTTQTQFQVNQDNTNAQLATLQSQSALQKGNEEADTIGLKTGAEIGAAKAGYASQGVVVGTGSSAAVQSNLLQKGTNDQQTVQTSAWRQAMGFQLNAIEYSGKAQFDQIEGSNEATQSLLTGGMQALGSVDKAFSPKVVS